MLWSSPRASIERDWLLLYKAEGQGQCGCGSGLHSLWTPAGLGSQFSLYPGGRRQGRQSSEGEEDTRGNERQRQLGQGRNWEM